MGCMKIGGRTVGVTDGPSIELPACFRSNMTRKRLGCDESFVPGSVMSGETDIIEELMKFLDTRLAPDDREAVTRILGGEKMEAVAPDMATDAVYRRRFPDAGRLKVGGLDFQPASIKTPPATAAQREEYALRFPHANRLK